MWHEEPFEMVQLLISLFKLDKHNFNVNEFLRSKDRNKQQQTAEEITIQDLSDGSKFISPEDQNDLQQTIENAGKYDLEFHIFFDDSLEKETQNHQPLRCNEYVNRLFRSIEEAKCRLYGDRNGVADIKGFKTPYGGRIECRFPFSTKFVIHLKDKSKIRARKRWSQVMYMYYLLRYKSKDCKDESAKNTFLLALDGDVDFKPDAVDQLVNRLRKFQNVGAACGRIHPIGSGPIVWYQKFEYAVSHWLQKATEHVTGCVLCSPGCFSLFRGSALSDTNVAKTYTKKPTEARHHVQYDQGEDRWLCTLLLKRGYRVEYVAVAFTYAPENFFDFWKQRRRWTPSTMANVLEILTDNGQLRRRNPDISLPFIIYQIFLFVSSVLTPGTIFMLVVGAVTIGFPSLSPMFVFFVNLVPVAVFMLLCLFAKEDKQLKFGAVLSAIYAVLMVIVLLGLLKTSVDQGFCSSTTIILVFVASVFIIAALAHPKEVGCVLHRFLFFISIPSISMLMFLYSMANLNNVSWGTRENSSEKKNIDMKGPNKRFGVIVGWFKRCCRNKLSEYMANDTTDDVEMASNEDHNEQDYGDFTEAIQNPGEIDVSEDEFWNKVIRKYLLPLNQTREEKIDQLRGLLNLRNVSILIIFLTNTFLVVGVFAITSVEAFQTSLVVNIECGNEGRKISIEPLSILFTLMFGILLLIQFICMIYHRLSTLVHIISEANYCGIDTTEDDMKSVLFNKRASKETVTSKDNTVINAGNQAVRNLYNRPTTAKREKTAINLIRERTGL